jgi:hypothetical protein
MAHPLIQTPRFLAVIMDSIHAADTHIETYRASPLTADIRNSEIKTSRERLDGTGVCSDRHRTTQTCTKPT